jgi:hypothetical protein
MPVPYSAATDAFDEAKRKRKATVEPDYEHAGRIAKGPSERSPYVPHWCYPRGPKMCPCGHHEGYHNDAGRCVLVLECKCAGLPLICRSTDEECMEARP